MAQDPFRYFRPEATDLVGQLGAGFIELERTGISEALVGKLFRVAHTLKGAARIVKHRELAELSHELETWMAALRQGGALPERLDEPLRIIDQMSAHVAAMSAPAPTPAAPTRTTMPMPTLAVTPVPVVAPAVLGVERTDLGALLDGLADVQVQIAQLRALDDPRSLPARLDQIDRDVRRIREETEQLQLIATSSLFAPLARVTRDTGVPVDFVGTGGEIRLEGSVLATLLPALVQLVRNAIAHGIEPAAERTAKGKPARARIGLDITQVSGRVIVRVSDDGRGIDLVAVRRKLVDKGVAAPALDDHAALIQALIAGGISTASSVTEMSGRGVGIDVVRDAARELGGELTATTSLGAGTTFVLTLPVSMSTLPAVMVSGGDHIAALPMTCIRKVITARAEHIVRGDRTVLVHDDASLPFAMLSQLLGGDPHPVTSIALVDRGGGDLVALGVEHVTGVRDVVQRARPRDIAIDPIVGGLLIDEEGVPRPVLAPAEIAAAVRAARTPAAPERRTVLPILVIDDSLTTRMLEQSILESAGYQVDLARSAEEGLAKAQRNRYALFLCDVEMPGMDGFTFVGTTRKDPQLAKVPAILVSSRNAPEDFRRGEQAGAAGYIVKGEFDQNELLALIARLV